jgi:hypothetical protein
MQWLPNARAGLLLFVFTAAGAAGGDLGKAQPGARATTLQLSQSQVASQFLRAVLRANYSAAYSRLAPEVRQGVGMAGFAAAARPLWKSGQRHGTAIELYKLGVRLGEGGSSRLFYSFSFAADSSLRVPSELLEVTFRDTASRAVLGFGLRSIVSGGPGKPAGKKTQNR